MIALCITIMIILITLTTGWVWLAALWIGFIAGIVIGYLWDIPSGSRRLL